MRELVARWPVGDVGGDLEIHRVNYSDGSRRYAVVEFGGVLRSFEDMPEAQAYALGWRDRKDVETLGHRTHQTNR